MSLLFGKKPVRRSASGAETALVGAADRLEGSLGGLNNVADLYLRSLASGRGAERADAIGARSADVAQAFAGPATSHNQALTNLVNRGRGLTRVVSATADEFDSQLMRDRIAAVRGGRARQARGLGALSTAAGLQDSVAQAVQARRDSDAATRANLLGSVAGIGLGFAANRGEFFNRPGVADGSPVGISPVRGYDPLTGVGSMNA